MKKILIFLSLVIAIVLGSVNCFAVGNTISEQEAKDLLLAANNYYCKYQGYVGSFLNNGDRGKPFITTKHYVSEAARKIYTEDIADNMWSYQCFWNSERYDEIEPTYLYCYSDNGDGTITIKSEFPMFFRVFYLCLDYSYENYNYQKIAETTGQIKIRNLSGDDQQASAVVEVYKAAMDCTGELVYMDVSFTKTSGGWRISGGSLVYAFSEWENPELKYESVCGKHPFLHGFQSEYMVNYAAQASDPDYNYKTCVKYENGSVHEMSLEEVNAKYQNNLKFNSFVLLSASEEKVIYTFVNELDGKTYDAIFTYDENYEYERAKYMNGSETITYKGAWRLTGGGVYDLVNGKTNVAPYTGDEANNTLLIAAVISIVSLLGMGIAIKARKV
ncbi:MAG: LPXTG cell wall anchor domain-containing protein [Clostridia bacterium]|nr:LPXTG cell wall anchor domain-containing protein [Clostridia bacterium]